MINFMMIFFPSFISLMIERKRNKLDKERMFLIYPIYTLTINVICMIILYLYKGGLNIYISEDFNILNFCLKYSLLAIVISIVLPYLKELIIKNIKFEIDIRRESKNEKKSK